MANIGNSPGVASQRVVTTFTATAGQTLFVPNGGYTLGYCDVFLNGIKLVNGDDYTAANGINFTLTSGAAVGDAVECVAYFPRGLSDGYMKAEADTLLALKFDKLGGDVSGRTVFKDPYRADQSYPLGIKNGSQQEWWFRAEPTSNTFDIALNGLGDVIKCDTAGRVITPYQPRFQSYGTSGRQTYGNGGAFTLQGTAINTGGYYNTSNGRFTAPVAGLYHFSYGVYTYITCQICIKKNGSDYSPGDTTGMTSLPSDTCGGASIAISLAAGDYVSYGFRNGYTGDVYTSHGWFSGFLVG